MINKRYYYDGKSEMLLNDVQKRAIYEFSQNIINNKYRLEKVKCECSSSEFELLSEKDRYGLKINLVICKKCGLVMLNPRMDQESYDDFYEKYYRKIYVGCNKPDLKHYEIYVNRGIEIYKFIEKEIDLNKTKKVLEIGCSAGGILEVFKNKGHEVEGIDLDYEYINFGKKRGLNLKRIHSKELVREGKKYDLIILSHVFEHFLDIKTELSCVRQLLKDSGYLYVEVPGLNNLIFCNDFLSYLQNAHIYYFNLTTLNHVMNRNGFKMIIGNEYIKAVYKKSTAVDVFSNQYFRTLRYIKELENNIKDNKLKVKYVSFMFYNSYYLDILVKKIATLPDRSIAIYGSGKHTEYLLEYIKDYKSKITNIYDHRNDGKFIDGYKVKNISCLEKNEKYIIISSKEYQENIYAKIKSLEAYDITILKIYG